MLQSEPVTPRELQVPITAGGTPERVGARRSLTRRTVSTVLGGALLAACGGADSEPSAPKVNSQPVTLRLNARSGGDEALWKFFQPRLKEKLPHVTIEVEAFDSASYLQKVTAVAAGGSLGDVIYSTTTSGLFDVLYNAKSLRAIDDLVRADKYDLKVFYRPGIDLLTREGKLYGLPNTCQPGSVVLYYNTSMLERDGASLPNPDWTPDDALNSARRVAKPGTDVWGYGLATDATGILAMVQSFGGRWLSKDGKKAEVNTPATRQAMTYMADLIQRHKVSPPPGVVNGGNIMGLLTGKMGMFIGSTSDATRLQSQTDVEVGTSLIPRVSKDLPRGIMRVDGYSISTASKAPREAWEAIKLTMGPEGSAARADVPGGSGTLGCTPNAWTNAEVLKKRGTMQQMYVRVLAESEVNIMAGNYRNDEYLSAITSRLDPVWKGEAQITDGLMQDMQQTVQLVLDKPKNG